MVLVTRAGGILSRSNAGFSLGPFSVVIHVLYSGYFLGGKIFVSSAFLASLWKNVRGCGILHHTLVLCGTVSEGKTFVVRFSTTKTTKILPSVKYSLYSMPLLLFSLLYYCTVNTSTAKLHIHMYDLDITAQPFFALYRDNPAMDLFLT